MINFKAEVAVLPTDPYRYCHRPVIVTDIDTSLSKAMQQLKVAQGVHQHSDDVLDQDVILVWNTYMSRVITAQIFWGDYSRGLQSL